MTLLYPSIIPPNGGVQAGHLGSFFIAPWGSYGAEISENIIFFLKMDFGGCAGKPLFVRLCNELVQIAQF